MSRLLLSLALLALLVAPALAAPDPLWTHGGTGPVRDVALSANGRLVVVSSDQLHVFYRSGEAAATTWPANDVALAPKGSLLAAATDEGVRALASNGTVLWTQPNRSAVVAVSGDGRTVASLTPGGLLAVCNAAGVRAGSAETGATGEVVDLVVSENGSVVVSADAGGLHAFTRKGALRWSEGLANPSALAMNGSGDRVAVGDGGSVKVYDLAGERIARFATAGRVRSLGMTPSANLTVAGDEAGTVTALGPDGGLLWNLSAGARVNRVAVSGSGALVAAATADRRLLLVAGNGTLLRDVPLGGEPVALALSADGTTVAVGCGDGTAYLFDTGLKAAATPTRTTAPGGTAPDATAGRTRTAAPNASASAGNATATPAAAETTPLALVIPDGGAESGVPILLPVASLLLLAGWAGLRRRRR